MYSVSRPCTAVEENIYSFPYFRSWGYNQSALLLWLGISAPKAAFI